MEETIPVTPRGKELLEKELEHLIKVEREENKQALIEARALGDLKENSEYHSAKEKQALIEGKIMELQHKIGKAQVVDIAQLNGNKVVFGTTVSLVDAENDKEVKYKIVGTDEADVKSGLISYTSPLAKALVGKEIGDLVIVKAPKGDIEYEIENIEFLN